MTHDPFAIPVPSSPIPGVRGVPDGQLKGASRTILIPAGLVLVVLIAWMDYATGPYLSCSIFYLIPVVGCAWWGGFPHATLLAVAGSIAGYGVDLVEMPTIPPLIGIWNGVVRFGTLTVAASLVARLHAGFHRERRLARSDPLTGAANARTFYDVTTVEVERARRNLKPLTLAYFDIDNFKQLNDRLGHAVGDEALAHIVQMIHAHTRSSDLLARLGGDEFALLLPEVGQEGALTTLVRLQKLLAEEMAKKGWPVTLSVGAVTFLRPHDDLDLMIQQVDALMYGAKRKGKGRVEHVVAGDGPADPPIERRWIERRGTARLLCNRAARLHWASADLSRSEAPGEKKEAFGTVLDLSAEGVRVALGQLLPEDTLVVVESLVPGPRTLLARVVNVFANGEGGQHGCRLATRLSAEELGVWLGFGHDFEVFNTKDVHEKQPANLSSMTSP